MRATFRRLFTEHPASVGETYREHFVRAASFGASMLVGAPAAFLHAAVPGVCTNTSSRIVTRLYDRMVVNRSRLPSNGANAPSQPDFLAEHI
jgi:hypothetical protein